MRVTFITTKLNFQTAGASVIELDAKARSLIKLGHQVKIITAFSGANAVKEQPPYEVINEDVGSGRQFETQRGVYRILKKYSKNADCFMVDGSVFLYGAGFYKMAGGKTPVVACFNRELTSWPEDVSVFFRRPNKSFLAKTKNKVRWFIERYLGMFLANKINLVTFTNPFLRWAYENFGLRKSDKEVMIFGDSFDYAAFMVKHGVTEDSYVQRNKNSGPFTIFYSSRMVPGKGFDLFIKAFAEVSNKENFKLILGGAGPEEEQARQMVGGLGLEKYVEMPGWLPKEKLYESFKNADIFVQPRWRTDLTSYSLLEAMAFGLPCILPRGGGLEWDAKNGALYFNEGDYKDLARKIEELGNNHDLRARLSRGCYARLKEDEMNSEKQMIKLCEKIKNL